MYRFAPRRPNHRSRDPQSKLIQIILNKLSKELSSGGCWRGSGEGLARVWRRSGEGAGEGLARVRRGSGEGLAKNNGISKVHITLQKPRYRSRKSMKIQGTDQIDLYLGFSIVFVPLGSENLFHLTDLKASCSEGPSFND